MSTKFHGLAAELVGLAGQLDRSVRFMEVCGTHTMAAFRTGLRSVLPETVRLLSGPGCPVCVTPTSYVDHAVAIARRSDVTVATFGDMLRVPGSECSLQEARALGGDVRVVYSPTDALDLARSDRTRQVVFLGIGFETTAPAVAWTVQAAAQEGVDNYAVLCGHKTIPAAMTALAADGAIGVDGFMCPGHVSVIIGSAVYEPLCRQVRMPCVVAGFEAADMARAMIMLLRQVLEKRAEVEVEYRRSVTREGNAQARALCEAVFEPCDSPWRGLGTIPGSGLRLRAAFAPFDAGVRFAEPHLPELAENKACRCGDVLCGRADPPDCPLFGAACTPEAPVGPCMVSSEGSCAAHFRYGGIPAGAGPAMEGSHE